MDLDDHLRALEEALLTPAVRRDKVPLADLLCEEFREFGSSGRVWTRAEILESLSTEQPVPFRLEAFKATPIAPEAVLLTYRVQREAASPEAPEASARAPQSLRSSLWIQREGRWQMLFHQGTPAALGESC